MNRNLRQCLLAIFEDGSVEELAVLLALIHSISTYPQNSNAAIDIDFVVHGGCRIAVTTRNCEMPHCRYGPKLVRYRLSEVEAWLSNRKVRVNTKSLARIAK